MRFDYTEGRDSSEIIIEEVNVDEFIKILNDTRLLKYGDDISNEKINDLKYLAEHNALQYQKALTQIAELEESAEELHVCYGETEKLNEEIDEWKLKYENECKHNDVIKKSYDRLAKSFEELVKERDEWKSKWERRKGNVEAFEELLKERDEYMGKYERNKEITNRLYGEVTKLQNELNEYKEIASDRDDLKVELDDANLTINQLKKNRDQWITGCETLRLNSMKYMDERDSANKKVSELERNVKYWQARYEDEINGRREDVKFWKALYNDVVNERIELKKELEKWQQKSES